MRRAGGPRATAFPILLLTAVVMLAGCGGSGQDAPPEATAPGGGKTLKELWRAPGDDVAVVPGTETHEPGRVRVSFLVMNAEGRPVTLPTARVWVARGLEHKPFLESQAKLERIGVPGSEHVHSSHIYVAHVRLRTPGKYWLLAEPEGGPEPVQALGNVVVRASSDVPAVGERAPVSDTPTLDDANGKAARITTRVPPDVTLLQHSVAETLEARRPLVVTFATPKYCTSRICGPVVDVVEDVARRYEDNGVRFIHVEVFESNDPAKGYNRWMEEWGLTTEPWTFVVGADGRIVERFEGAVSVHELERALRDKLRVT
jgi:hypothetical protein